MHTPVMFDEVMTALRPQPGGTYLDATVGGGGHTHGLLAASKPDGRVLGTDADSDAIARAKAHLAEFGSRVVLRQAWLDEAADTARELGFVPVDGLLVDLGLSSNQLADDERGFSFMRDGPLDMRFDAAQGIPASMLIEHTDVAGLTRLLAEYGEVEHAHKVADAIWSARPIMTTGQLRAIVEGVVLRRHGRSYIHPATQVFQALRIAVNDELRRIRDALPSFVDILAPGGRLAVITFHSLEDRIVKRFFREAAMEPLEQPGFGLRGIEKKATVQLLTRKPLGPSAAEVLANPRSRSAKLRVVEKLA